MADLERLLLAYLAIGVFGVLALANVGAAVAAAVIGRARCTR